MATRPSRRAGAGWLALVGGGEFSFEETERADAAWLAHVPPGTVGFLPTASGSVDYGNHFAVYLDEYFERGCETIPVFRPRDARRQRNAERIAAAPALYLGGGVADQLLAVLPGSPCGEALGARLGDGGTVVAIAAAAQAAGKAVRSLRGDRTLPGFDWLDGGVVDTNFDPGHDRRLRKLLRAPGVAWGLAIPAGSAVLLGGDGAVETVGQSFLLDHPEGALAPLGEAA